MLQNVIVIAIFGFTRRYVAFGALWAFVCALIATVIDAPVGTVACVSLVVAQPTGSSCITLGCRVGDPAPVIVGYGSGFLVGLIPGYFILRQVHRELGK